MSAPDTLHVVSVPADVGEPLFGALPERADPREAGTALVQHLARQGLGAQDMNVQFDARTRTATLTGTAPDQATRERMVVCCGNVRGVAEVCDMMQVALPARPSHYYTVAGGDTLAKIAQQHYRNPLAFGRIFEANRPMLRDPERIYPGQLLRIPV